MKTGAPGKFDCEIYLKAWQLGGRGPYVMEHIDACPWCGPIVHGDGEDFLLSIEEEADLRLKARARARRRRFLKVSAASFLGLLLAGFGARAVLQKDDVVTKKVLREQRALGVVFQNQGREGIERLVRLSTSQDAMAAVDWILETRQLSLLDLAVECAGDSRSDVKLFAIARLFEVNPVDLKPFVERLRATGHLEVDPDLRRDLFDLASIAEDA